MFKAVIVRSRGQDSGRLSKQGFQRLAMGDPERLSLPPWENEKMGLGENPCGLWDVTCPPQCRFCGCPIISHPARPQVVYTGVDSTAFWKLSRLSACLEQRSEHPISILDLKPTLSTSSFICESQAQRSRVICPVSASRGD